jgi:hypothetical protein
MSALEKQQTIKGLKSQLAKAQGKAKALKVAASQANREYSEAANKAKQLQIKIDAYSQVKEISITEHAMLRYFERVLEYDIEEVEGKIITNELKRMVDTLGGDGTYPVGDFSVVMRNYRIVTIK